ncbi:hypothetical protein HY468_02085 [Candidatus Roizmanbacteria bacterium]|nr:hypothetical protein [Candidatus Roizmanbacteria bacterium]
MIRKSIIFLSILLLFILTLQPAVAAVRLLPRFKSGAKPATSISTRSSNSVIVSPGFMPGRAGLRVSFSSIQNAKKISYILSYETNGKTEGITGSITPADGTSTTRDMLFGTCSSGTCVKHMGIKNAQLTVTTDLTSGKKSIRKYKIRV